MTQQLSTEPDSSSPAALAVVGVLIAFLVLCGFELLTATTRAGTNFDPVFCSPSALHTTLEPPETQLTRDNAIVRLLLKDTGDHFVQIRKIYEGEIHISPVSSKRPALLQRGGSGGLFKPDYQRHPWRGSLQEEAQRLDVERGTALAISIENGIQTGDRNAIEAALRATFTALLDDLLMSIEQKLGTAIDVGRTLQYARRYYSEGLDAYLSINASSQAARASYALDAMARAADDLKAGNLSSRDWFAHERVNFMRAIHEGIHSQLAR
jgi:hypothetical protein